MKRLSFLSVLCMALTLTLVFQSCSEDDSPTPSTDDPATVSLETAPGFISTDFLQDAGTTFMVRLSASEGTNPMRDLAIKLDGSNIAFSEIMIDGSPASANPTLLFDADKTSFTKDIQLTVPSSGGAQIYSFVVTDDTGLTGSTSLEVTPLYGAPVLTFTAYAPFLFEDATVSANTDFAVELNGVQSNVSVGLNTLSVYENDTLISINRMANSSTPPTNNPIFLSGSDQESFVLPLQIRSHNAGSTSTYRFVLDDILGFSDTVSLNISTGTPIDTTMTGVLLNAGGPAGTGGLDLDTGEGTGSQQTSTGNPTVDNSYLNAEIKDEGIDINLPVPENWLQRISGINGTEVRQVGISVPETFDFDAVASKDEIEAAFDLSDVFTDTNSNSELISDVVEVDNMYIVKKGSTEYYLIRVTNIDVTSSGNGDSYTFDIKY